MKRRNMAYGVARSVLQALALLSALLLAAPASAQGQDKLVLAFGDSLMAGYGLAPAQAFPARLEAALRKSGVKVQVRNGSVSGDTSAAGKARLAWVLNALKRKPDLVIVELGANDMLRGLSPAQTRANLDAILAELKRRQIRVLVAGMRAAPNMGRPMPRSSNRSSRSSPASTAPRSIPSSSPASPPSARCSRPTACTPIRAGLRWWCAASHRRWRDC